MKNRTLAVILIILMALASSVPYWLDAIYQSENNGFLYTAVIFWLTAIACVCSTVFLFIGVKKVSDKVWLLLFLAVTIGGFFLARTSVAHLSESKIN